MLPLSPAKPDRQHHDGGVKQHGSDDKQGRFAG